MNDWVQQNLGEYINDGVVKYLHTKQAPHFEMDPEQKMLLQKNDFR